MLGWLLLLVGISGCQSKMQDLTHKLNKDTVVWPGRAKFQLEVEEDYSVNISVWDKTYNARANVNKFLTTEHIGTHMDAPSHIYYKSAGTWTLDQIPIDRFIAPAVVIDITKRAAQDPDASVQVSDLVEWEKEHGRIPDNALIMMSSGWDSNWPNASAMFGTDMSANVTMQELTSSFHFPGIHENASSWLLQNRKIVGAASDTPSVDPGNTRTFGTHLLMMEKNMILLEMVKNLGNIPPSGATVYAMPMLIEGGSGAPTRVIASWGEDKITCGASSISLTHQMGLLLLAIVLSIS